MTQKQLERTGETAEENPDTITVVDRNGNTDSLKFKQTGDRNINTNNDNETTTQKSTRKKH